VVLNIRVALVSKMSQVWLSKPIVPATWEAKKDDCCLRPSWAKSRRPYLKNKLRAIGFGAWFKW
jgi:hypothetical protein